MGGYEAHSQRMRQTICDAMVSLLEEKSFRKITVQDIMEKAQIQRATFYRYYRDKYEVAEAINALMAEHLAETYFTYYYRQRGFNRGSETLFDAKYRKVLGIMLQLRVEGVDLFQALREAFRRAYLVFFPDATPFEIHMASANFVSCLFWFLEAEATVADIEGLMGSLDHIQWVARYFHVPPPQLAEFVNQHQV